MNNKKIRNVLVISMAVILAIILVIIMFLKDIKNIKEDNTTEIEQNQSNVIGDQAVNGSDISTKEDEAKIEELKELSEAERIKSYLGTYFKHLENKEYNSAYTLLYSKYKQNYFPTLDDYKKYIDQEKLPDMLAIEYASIYTQGKYYIVKVRIGNMLDRAEVKKEKTYIIQENDYNDYYLSFKK